MVLIQLAFSASLTVRFCLKMLLFEIKKEVPIILKVKYFKNFSPAFFNFSLKTFKAFPMSIRIDSARNSKSKLTKSIVASILPCFVLNSSFLKKV
jgi:hypothetical protein